MSATESLIPSPPGGLKLPVGVSDFDKLVRENYTFVDKSLLIRDVIEDGA